MSEPKTTSILIVQSAINVAKNRWYDLCTLGKTLDEVREELQDYKNRELFDGKPLRIIQRITTVEEMVIE